MSLSFIYAAFVLWPYRKELENYIRQVQGWGDTREWKVEDRWRNFKITKIKKKTKVEVNVQSQGEGISLYFKWCWLWKEVIRKKVDKAENKLGIRRKKHFLKGWNGKKAKGKQRKKDANLENGVKNLYENKKWQ